MKPLIAALLALVATAHAAAAQDTISVRAGEHPTYSRLVIGLDADIGWEFRALGRRATLVLPDTTATFDVNAIFRRIPKTRLLSANSTQSGGSTLLELTLACACPVQAQVLNDLLFIDIRDPAAAPREDAARPPTAPGARAPLPPPRPITDMSAAFVPPAATQEIDADVSANAVADRLLTQLNRAAEQGYLEFAEETPPPADPSATTDPMAETAAIAEMDAPQTPATGAAMDDTAATDPMGAAPAPAPSRLQPVVEDIDGLASLADRVERAFRTNGALSDLGGAMSVRLPNELTIDSRPVAAPPPPPVVMAAEATGHCPDPALFDVRYWSDERPAARQISEQRGRVFGEFDAPDEDAAVNLARLYVALGFGVEAIDLIDDLGIATQAAQTVQEIAGVVSDLPPRRDGIIDRSAGCPGAPALWRTAAFSGLETQPVSDADQIVDRFAEMPVNLRRQLAPRLVTSLLARGQFDEAKTIFAIVARAPGPLTPAHDLLRAQLLIGDGAIAEAEALFHHLVRLAGDEAVTAARLLIESYIARGVPVPATLVTEIEALAFAFRGSAAGHDLRLTEMTAKAGSDRLGDALRVVRKEAPDGLQPGSDIAVATNRILAGASVQQQGSGAYATAIFEHIDLLASPGIAAETRTAVAAQVIDAGLPATAADILRRDTNTDVAVPVLARAYLASDRLEETIALLEGRADPEARMLRAAAYARLGDHAAALTEAAETAAAPVHDRLAWRAGDWAAVTADADAPMLQRLAGFMNRRATPARPDTQTLTDLGVDVPDDPLLPARPAADADEMTLATAQASLGRSQAVRDALAEAIAAY